MPNVSRINAIRRMYNGAQNGQVKLDSGECIHSWVLLDETGAVVNHHELDDTQIAEAYDENLNWMEPEYEKSR